MKTVGAVFHSEEDARQAYSRLQDAGVPGDDISMVLCDQIGQRRVHVEQVRDANEWAGAGVGAAAGAGLAAGLGAAGVALTIPVVGPVIAMGALAGILSATGGTLGWLAGGLAAGGMTGEEARFYESALAEGGILLTVKTNEENLARVQSIIRTSNGKEYPAG